MTESSERDCRFHRLILSIIFMDVKSQFDCISGFIILMSSRAFEEGHFAEGRHAV